MSLRVQSERAIEQGKGILHLVPTWVPRSFCIPGRRLKLHPDDYYAFGGERGGIDERWFSSTANADNGALTSPDEGLSRVAIDDGDTKDEILFRDVISELKGELIGERIWNKYQRWPMFAKFFDNMGPLPHHIHHDDTYAKEVGKVGKPEAYYFPPQLNNHGGKCPYTFFGFEPGTTREQVKECLVNFAKGDNKITNLSRAYRLEVGTGWDIPPRILHAPGSLLTYEPQQSADIFSMYQSLVDDQIVTEDLLWRDLPADRMGDVEYLLDLIDWDANLDPNFKANHFMQPMPVKPIAEMSKEGYIEKWISYQSDVFSAKELTVLPGRTVTIFDQAAYGMIMMQGHGQMGVWKIESPAMIRFGQSTNDEYFVSESAARKGVTIVNESDSEPLVMLKHFGPGNPDVTGQKK